MTTTAMLKIVLVTFAAFSLYSGADALRGRKFMSRNDYTTALALPLDTWSSPSVVSCAVTCWNKYPNGCMSFRYNTTTEQCTWSRPVEVASLTNPYLESDFGSVDDMYSRCPDNSSFRFYTLNYSTYCFYFSSLLQYETQEVAATICESMGGKLVTIKTLEKWAAVNHFLHGVLAFWIGLDDKRVEGIFRWEGSGQEVDEVVKTTIFHTTDLLSTNITNDCVYYSLGTVYEELCEEKHNIVCEAD